MVWECVKETVDSVVRRVDQTEGSPIVQSRGRLGKTIRETVEKDLEVKDFDEDMIYDIALYRPLIHVVNST